MKIIIDCFKLIRGEGKSSGIYNLSMNLVKNLDKEIRTSGSNDELIVLGNEINRTDFEHKTVKYIPIKGYSCRSKLSLILWELIGSQLIAQKLGGDVIIYPRGFCGLIHPVKDIVIIHDMIPFYYNRKFPKVLGRIENAYIMLRLSASAQSCNKIITISEYSKQDILKYSKTSSHKITVINNGYNEINNPPKHESKDKDFIVAITTKLPHKNAIGIVKAYERYLQIANNPLLLRIIGISKEDFKNLCQNQNVKISENTINQISFEGFIKDDQKMHAMLANAKLFLFLSLYEGFGFPPLEAMQLGVPVICSNATSLPEVTNDAAILVNPENIDEAANAINKILSDETERQKLIQRGYKNITRFNWTHIAKEYMKAIHDI